MSAYEYSVVTFTESLQASFIGPAYRSDAHYAPRILANDDEGSANVLETIKSELSECTDFASPSRSSPQAACRCSPASLPS